MRMLIVGVFVLLLNTGCITITQRSAEQPMSVSIEVSIVMPESTANADMEPNVEVPEQKPKIVVRRIPVDKPCPEIDELIATMIPDLSPYKDPGKKNALIDLLLSQLTITQQQLIRIKKTCSLK